jgi:hypothetical protein
MGGNGKTHVFPLGNKVKICEFFQLPKVEIVRILKK